MARKKAGEICVSKLQSVVTDINKLYGSGTLIKASEATSLVIDRIPTGVFDLDMRLGGGWPRGRISTIIGDFSTCKSGLTLKAMAQAQALCRHCGKPMYSINIYGEINDHGCACGKDVPMRVALLDSEHAHDPSWAQKLGVNTDDLYLIQTEFAEQGIDVADYLVRSQEIDLLVVDSIAAMTPSTEVEDQSSKWQMGLQARLMGKMCRKLTSGLNSFGLLGETKCTILLINQIRMNIGGYGASQVTPGGNAIKFFESLQIKMKRTGYVIHNERPVAAELEYVVIKNKTAPPTGEGGKFSFFIVPIGGMPIGSVDNHVQVLRLATYWGLLEKNGSWITMPNGEKYQGDLNAATALRENSELLESLSSMVREQELSWVQKGV